MTDHDEIEPLLSKSETGEASSSYVSIFDDNDSELGVQKSRRQSMSAKKYGAMTKSRAVDVVYSWNNINVFTSETKTKKGCLSFFRRRSDKGAPKPMKQILKNVSGEAWPGELLAIMGSSGAGKTTLLNTLTFKCGKDLVVGGTRALGKRPMTAFYLTSLSAYVRQDDMFIGTLTVREHLVFQSLVRMDKSLTFSKKIQRVNQVISELALTKCQNTMIGSPGRLKGISGGEMKRLSFASEVLTDPPLLFCDEPTSGLDSFMAQNVLQVLKGLAKKGKTVLITIHQPSSVLYGMFDKLLLMAEGRVAFLGTPDQASMFFSSVGSPCPKNYNPADFYIQELSVVHSRDKESRQRIEEICDTFKKSALGAKLEVTNLVTNEAVNWDIDDSWTGTQKAGATYRVSWCSQFAAVLWRSYKSIIKEPLLIKVRVIQTILVSGLIGTIYFGQHLDQDGVMNINGALFIFITNMTFQNIFAVINVFCAEFNLFLRENRSGLYRTDVYFLAKTIAEFPVFLICPVVFIGICYYLVGMNPDPYRFLWANLIIIMVTTVATSFGYMVSCFAGKVNLALTAGPPLVIPFMLFGGFFLNNASVPWFFSWMAHLSWFKYGNEALMVNQWSGIDAIMCTRSVSVCPVDGRMVLDTLNFYEENFYYDLVLLGVLVLLFRLLAFLALLFRAYRNEV